MAMNVVDVSSYQASLNLANIRYDGVAIKATEGISYVNPDCDKHYQEAKAQGKKRAVYHFFDFSVDAVAQANYFVDNCIGYIHDAIFVLDWEGSGVADISAAVAFLRQVEARIGYKPAIYMSQWVENSYNWSEVVSNNNGLWIARYSNWELVNHASDWDMSQAGQAPSVTHWPFYFMWQWTSTGLLSGYAGNLDCNIAYLTPDQWDKYAGVLPPPPPTTTTPTTAAPPEPPAPDPAPVEAAPTTTVAPVNQAPSPDQPSVTTTTTVALPPQPPQPTWLEIVVMAFVAFIRRLQGRE